VWHRPCNNTVPYDWPTLKPNSQTKLTNQLTNRTNKPNKLFTIKQLQPTPAPTSPPPTKVSWCLVLPLSSSVITPPPSYSLLPLASHQFSPPQAPTPPPTPSISCDNIYLSGASPSESGGECVGHYSRTIRDEAGRPVYSGKCGNSKVFLYYFKELSSWAIGTQLNIGPVMMTAKSAAAKPNLMKDSVDWRQTLRGLPYGLPSKVSVSCKSPALQKYEQRKYGVATAAPSQAPTLQPPPHQHTPAANVSSPKKPHVRIKKRFAFSQGHSINCKLPDQWRAGCLMNGKCCVNTQCIACGGIGT
jgi:hypothetical protein